MTNRQKVAEKLRQAHKNRMNPEMWGTQDIYQQAYATLEELKACLMNNESDIFTQLADLIEPMYEPCSVWIAWVESLKNGGVVDRFAYDLIVHGGDMGPNGNTWDGVDEGTVLTNQLFDKFKADFKKEIEADRQDRGGEPCLGSDTP